MMGSVLFKNYSKNQLCIFVVKIERDIETLDQNKELELSAFKGKKITKC